MFYKKVSIGILHSSAIKHHKQKQLCCGLTILETTIQQEQLTRESRFALFKPQVFVFAFRIPCKNIGINFFYTPSFICFSILLHYSLFLVKIFT